MINSIRRRILAAFALVLATVVCCLGLSSFTAIQALEAVSTNQQVHAQSFVPAKRLTTAFEREILNARIFFIYFVTIQKPGSLEKGWQRYHNAEARLKEMSLLINQFPELSDLRQPAAKLRADIATYGEALSATLNMVQGGELKGPHYDAQVKEWAARGAVMVTDAGNLESLCFRSSEADTNSTLRQVRDRQSSLRSILLVSVMLLLALTLYFVRKVRFLLSDSQPLNELAGLDLREAGQEASALTLQ